MLVIRALSLSLTCAALRVGVVSPHAPPDMAGVRIRFECPIRLRLS
jgi:hypothetical protein